MRGSDSHPAATAHFHPQFATAQQGHAHQGIGVEYLNANPANPSVPLDPAFVDVEERLASVCQDAPAEAVPAQIQGHNDLGRQREPAGKAGIDDSLDFAR